MTPTKDQIKQAVPHARASVVEKMYPHLIDTMAKYQINTPARICAFLAQVAHESGSFNYLEEIASGSAYDTGALAKRLGNTPEDDGDGEKYKGRGLIQITGTDNYKKVGEALGINFFENPELLEDPKWATMSAGWFWDSRRLNLLADVGDFRGITVKINGGVNGFLDRVKRWEEAKRVFYS